MSARAWLPVIAVLLAGACASQTSAPAAPPAPATRTAAPLISGWSLLQEGQVQGTIEQDAVHPSVSDPNAHLLKIAVPNAGVFGTGRAGAINGCRSPSRPTRGTTSTSPPQPRAAPSAWYSRWRPPTARCCAHHPARNRRPGPRRIRRRSRGTRRSRHRGTATGTASAAATAPAAVPAPPFPPPVREPPPGPGTSSPSTPALPTPRHI